MNVLIVDDEKREVLTIQKLLNEIPVNIERIYEAFNIQEASEIIKKYSISIMFCDVEMPGGTGLALTKYIRNFDEEIQVIYLTGHADFAYVRTALRLGAVDYLLKPVTKIALEEALRKALKRMPEEEKMEQHMDARTIVNEVRQFIQQNCDHVINRVEIAEKYYIHPDYLSHIFKNETGVSLSDYTIQVRMNKAKKMLAQTNFPVANSCGYANTAFFAKHFRRITGMSPKEYRNSLKQEKEDEDE